MMRHYRFRMGLVGLAVTGLSLATVGSSPAWASTKSAKTAAAKTAKTTKMTVGILPVADAGGYYTAVKQGFFTKRHLDVTPATIAGGAALVPAPGIPEGRLLPGVPCRAGGALTHPRVMRSKGGPIRPLESQHQLSKLRAYSAIDFDRAR